QAVDVWFGQAMPALNAAADDLIAYGRTIIPDACTRLDAALKGGDQATARKVMEMLMAEATARAQRIGNLPGQLDTLVVAAAGFRDAYNRLERNPPVRVMLHDIPFLCLSHDDAGQVIAGDVRNDSPANWWTVHQDPSNGFTILVAHDGRLLYAPPHPFMFMTDAPMPRRSGIYPLMIEKEFPRPVVVAGETISEHRELVNFLVPGPGQAGCISSVLAIEHTLDCCGNDGWQQGTPILHWMQNGGANQRWSFDPPFRPTREVWFHEAIMPLAEATGGLPAVEHLEGDWLAIVHDMQFGIQSLQSLSTNSPLLAQLNMQQVISAWAHLADEVAAARV
ncbi:MAG: hypothetical protein ACM31L_12415, partial [Actinomycetota bacterium]